MITNVYFFWKGASRNLAWPLSYETRSNSPFQDAMKLGRLLELPKEMRLITPSCWFRTRSS